MASSLTRLAFHTGHSLIGSRNPYPWPPPCGLGLLTTWLLFPEREPSESHLTFDDLGPEVPWHPAFLLPLLLGAVTRSAQVQGLGRVAMGAEHGGWQILIWSALEGVVMWPLEARGATWGGAVVEHSSDTELPDYN